MNKCDINMDFHRIKLIIWDLDDTFWKGTLSEGNVYCPEENVLLVKLLTMNGVINSISSKNDTDAVLSKLEDIEKGFSSYFVFNNINWSDKGGQIKEKLEKMNLRAENALFIDDNVRNLEEVAFLNPGIMVSEPNIIIDLISFITAETKNSGELKDVSCSRLNQYKMLEKRCDAKQEYDSNEQFLYESNIRVDICFDCIPQLGRIYELVERTNQLNYTKQRCNRIELEKQLTSDWNKCAYISVCDRFGEYGIVGFFCYNLFEKKMEHFLFSCRIMGLGIEQYIYTRMGSPEIQIVEPIASSLQTGKEVPWIFEDTNKTIVNQKEQKNDQRIRVLLKGPCDLSAIEQYLIGGSITPEFNFVNSKGFITTGQNHSIHIYEGNVLGTDELQNLLADAPFLIGEDFKSLIFEREYNVVCYSLLPDCHAGVYQHKESNLMISFGSVNFDMTDEDNWNGYINGTLPNHFYPFTEKSLEDFKDKWQFVGTTPDEVLIFNLDYIYDNIPGNPIIVLLLGSEIEYKGNNPEFSNHASRHQHINKLVKEWAAEKNRIKLINITEFINNQADYLDSINHFSRQVYYDLATRIVSYINEIN